jgi:hypothetical protein
MIDSGTQIECEAHNIVPLLPRLQPFDLSIRLDHSLDTGHWKTPYNRIGFDVTIIHSIKPSSSTTSEAAQYNEMDLRLRDGETTKFARPRGEPTPSQHRPCHQMMLLARLSILTKLSSQLQLAHLVVSALYFAALSTM